MADTETLIDSGAVRLDRIPVAQTVVRCADPDLVARLELPGACTLTRSGDEARVWLGPTEWLLHGPGPAEALLSDVVDRIGGGAAYALDVSGQRVRLDLSGPRAETVLAHGCALDLSDGAFAADAAAQTLLAQAGVLVHRLSPTAPSPGFTIFVRSSYAHYLVTWLRDAATEYLAAPA